MSHTDPIADMFARIRNAQMRGHATTKVPLSKVKINILTLLKNEGYIREFSVQETIENKVQRMIQVDLKYSNGTPVIRMLDRVSTPGCRVYSSVDKLPRLQNGLGIYILSTSKGIMSDHQARQENVGGEVIAKVF